MTIVTTDTAEGPLGMTANSFSSVSLTPPLVLWSPALASGRHDAFTKAATFCIHVLSDQQLEMAQHFARNGDGFDRFQWAPGPLGAPRLAGCLAEFHCNSYAIHPAGDHSLILGEVQQVMEGRSDRAGLIFDRGRFGRFSDDMEG